MEQLLRTKVLIGILAALSVIAVLLAHELRVNQQTAISTAKTAEERERAAQIDREDRAAVQRIRERNAQKADNTSKR
jgi:uncharacterized membrane protein